jgi:hypothetical protein
VIVAGAEFLVRGPIRAVQSGGQFNDLLSPYIQSRAWLLGRDPYSPQTLLSLWPQDAAHFEFLPKEVADGTLAIKRGFPTAYPLTCLMVLVPFSLLPWKLAWSLWLAISVTLFAATVWVLLLLAGISAKRDLALLFVAMALALAPFHTGIVTSNLAVVATEISVIAIWLAGKEHENAAGVLLALAISLKPQIGLCFLAYCLVRHRWRIAGITVAVAAAIALAAFLRLEFGHTPWLQSYLADNQALFGRGVLADFTPRNPTRFGLINLQLVLYPLAGTVRGTNVLAALVGAVMLAAWLVFMLRKRDSGTELADLSAVAVMSLLPVYHRFYDAVLLILPLAWAVAALQHQRRKTAILALLLMVPFLLPGGSLLETLQTKGHIPDTLMNRWWWNTIVMPHQVWALLFLSLVFLYEMAAGARTEEPLS